MSASFFMLRAHTQRLQLAATSHYHFLPFRLHVDQGQDPRPAGTGCAPILLIMEKQRKGEVQCRRNRLGGLKMEKTFAKSRQIPPNSTPNSAEFF
jgi:hypothetical protein